MQLQGTETFFPLLFLLAQGQICERQAIANMTIRHCFTLSANQSDVLSNNRHERKVNATWESTVNTMGLNYL